MAVYTIEDYDIPPSLLTALNSIAQNPLIPDAPLGAQTDSIYESEEAQLRAAYLRKYADVLRQLGYIGPDGKVIKGSLELEADRRRAAAFRNAQLAKFEAIDMAQREGNFFSGYHPVRQARMEFPYWQEITDINTALPKMLADQMLEAERALEEYTLGRNLSLSQAAARAAEAARNNPAGGTGKQPGEPGWEYSGGELPDIPPSAWMPPADTLNKILGTSGGGLYPQGAGPGFAGTPKKKKPKPPKPTTLTQNRLKSGRM